MVGSYRSGTWCPLCGVLMLIFSALYMRDRRDSGYVVERIGA